MRFFSLHASVAVLRSLAGVCCQEGGRIVMSNPSDGRLELLVKNLVPSDMSNYTCLSVNKAGSHDKNGTITVNCELLLLLLFYKV